MITNKFIRKSDKKDNILNVILRSFDEKIGQLDRQSCGVFFPVGRFWDYNFGFLSTDCPEARVHEKKKKDKRKKKQNIGHPRKFEKTNKF